MEFNPSAQARLHDVFYKIQLHIRLRRGHARDHVRRRDRRLINFVETRASRIDERARVRNGRSLVVLSCANVRARPRVEDSTLLSIRTGAAPRAAAVDAFLVSVSHAVEARRALVAFALVNGPLGFVERPGHR
eukprot:9669-Pelagococcus_subviridis.AAC.1